MTIRLVVQATPPMATAHELGRQRAAWESRRATAKRRPVARQDKQVSPVYPPVQPSTPLFHPRLMAGPSVLSVANSPKVRSQHLSEHLLAAIMIAFVLVVFAGLAVVVMQAVQFFTIPDLPAGTSPAQSMLVGP